MRKTIWLIAGMLSVGLGVLGIFLPVLPTTPFLLLAAYCFGRGSERFYHWLVDRSRLGIYIRSYRESRGIPFLQKVLTIMLLWLMIGFSIVFVSTAWWLKALLAVVAVGVTIHLGKIKTLQQGSPDSKDKVDSIELVEVS